MVVELSSAEGSAEKEKGIQGSKLMRNSKMFGRLTNLTSN